jgi:hypothetical protein
MRCWTCGAESDRGFCEQHRDPGIDAPLVRTQEDTSPGLVVHIPTYACKADDVTRGLPVCPAVRRDKSGSVVTEHGRQIRVTEDGRKTTMNGSAIIDSKHQRELHKKRWGMEEG